MGNLLAINGEIINSQEPLPIPVDILTLLWENPNPSASFAAQSIAVNDSDVDFFVIFFRYVYNATSLGRTEIVPKMFPQIWNEFQQGQGAQSGGTLVYRGVKQTTAGSITFEDAKIGSAAGSWSTDNNYLIPYKIYGFKKKIFMNDSGLTPSAEYSSAEHMVGHWINGKPVYEKTISFAGPSTSPGQAYVDLSSLNIDMLIKDEAMIKRSASGNATHSANTWTYNSTADGTFSHSIATWLNDSSSIYYFRIIRDTSNVFSNATIYVTLRYTKTTD